MSPCLFFPREEGWNFGEKWGETSLDAETGRCGVIKAGGAPPPPESILCACVGEEWTRYLRRTRLYSFLTSRSVRVLSEKPQLSKVGPSEPKCSEWTPPEEPKGMSASAMDVGFHTLPLGWLSSALNVSLSRTISFRMRVLESHNPFVFTFNSSAHSIRKGHS